MGYSVLIYASFRESEAGNTKNLIKQEKVLDKLSYL